MIDWKNYRQELTGRIGEIGRLSPDTVRGYQTLAGAGQKTARLDGKTRELISLAVAVTTRCDGCISFHSAAALEQGASRGRDCRSTRSRCGHEYRRSHGVLSPGHGRD